MKYGYSRISIRKLNLSDKHLFKFRAGKSNIALIYRIDILRHTWILIIRKNAFLDHIDELAYGYL